MYTPDIPGYLNTAIPSSPTTNSINETLVRSGGILVTKSITLNVNNGTQQLGCFTLTGSVLVQRLWGALTDTTTLTNCTATYFDLYDSAAAVVLTKNDGVLSGLPVGTVFAKAGLAAATFAVSDNTNGAVSEPAAAGVYFSECCVTKKTGATTTIRLVYTSTDAPANATALISCIYAPVTAGSSLVPA